MNKPSAKSSGGKKAREMVPQPHGGALLPGAGGGPQPGSGRPRDEVRAKFRELVEAGFPLLEGIIEGRVPVKMVGICESCAHEHEDYELLPTDLTATATPADRDRLKAIDISAKYGLAKDTVGEELVREMARGVGAVLRPLPNGGELLKKIHDQWLPIIAERL